MKESRNEFPESDEKVAKKDDILYQFVTFKLGGGDYAVNIQYVKEVTVTPKISRIPKTPAFIKGIANVRGDLIAIIDLEERFGMKPVLRFGGDVSSDSPSFTIVIDADTYTVGFVVKEMPNTLVLGSSQIDNSTDVMEKVKFKNKFISGLGKTGDDNIVVLLDILKLLSKKEIHKLHETKKNS